MNKKLKFSWGHILTFVALIVYTYITYVGLVYLLNCNFLLAGIVTFPISILLLFFFVGAQQFKGADKASYPQFNKNRTWERIFLVASFLFYVVLSYPFFHTWNVQNRHQQIEEGFVSSIDEAKQLFSEYEKYAEHRVTEYGISLTSNLAAAPRRNAAEIQRATVQKEVRLEALRLQLLSSNYDTLKNAAYAWIDKANGGATVWNVFLLGNLDQIDSAFSGWLTSLQSERFSGKQMKDEASVAHPVLPFDNESLTLKKASSGLASIKNMFTQPGMPSPWGWGSWVLCCFFFVFPYLIQPYSSKNPYRLLGYAGWANKDRLMEDEQELKEARIAEKRNSAERKKKNNELREIAKSGDSKDDGRVHSQGGDLI